MCGSMDGTILSTGTNKELLLLEVILDLGEVGQRRKALSLKEKKD